MAKYKIAGREVSRDEFMAQSYGLPYGETFSFGITGTDRTFMAGTRHGGGIGSLAPYSRTAALRAAKRAGVSLNGKKHISGLGNVTDMRSWVDGEHDVVSQAKSRNLNVDISGRTRHKAHEVPPPPPKALADDIVDTLVDHEESQTGKPVEREAVVEKYAPPWKK